MGVSLKKDLHVLRMALDAAFPLGEPWVLPSAPPNRPLIKWREALVAIFPSWSFYGPPGNFSTDFLGPKQDYL